MEKRYKVPEGMLQYVADARGGRNIQWTDEQILEAGIRWLDGELDRLREQHGRWEDAVKALRRGLRDGK